MADTTVSVETKLVGAQEIAQGFKDIAKAADDAKSSVSSVGNTDTSKVDTAATAIVDAFKKASDEAVKLKATTADIGKAIETASGGGAGGATSESPLVKKFREAQEAARTLKEGVTEVGKATEQSVGGKATEAVSGFSKVAIAASIGVTALAAAVGYAAVKLWEKTKLSYAYAEVLYNIKEATGKSTESLQGWDLAARQTGTSLEAVVGTMNRLTIGLFRGSGTGGQGAGRLRHILESVGIDPKSVKDGEDAMLRIADTMRAMTPTDRINVAMSLGISTDMIQMLSQGSVEIKRLADETNSMVILSREAIEAQDLFGDSLIRIKTVAMGLGNTLLNEFLPTVATMAARWADILVAMRTPWESFVTLVTKGLPGGERFADGLESARGKVVSLGKELDDMYEKQSRGGNRLDVARREQMMESLRVEINAAKALVAEYERVLEVTTKREEAGQPFMGPPLPPIDPFSRKRRDGSDPSDGLRDMINKTQRELAMAANAIDNSPEARQWYEASHGIIKKYEDSQRNEDPKLRIQLKLVQEAMVAEMDLFIQRRGDRLQKMTDQDKEHLVRSLTIAAAEKKAIEDTITAQEQAQLRALRVRAQAAEDEADPLAGFIRESERAREEFKKLGYELSPEAWQKIQEGIAKGFGGMAKETKESSKAFDELLRAVEGFGKQFSDNLYTAFERGENIIDSFFSNLGKIAAKRILFEAVGKPIDNMIQGVIQQFASPQRQAGGGGKSDAGIWSLVLNGIVGAFGSGGGWDEGTAGASLGNFAKGGHIPPGYSGIVGEAGYEMITAGSAGATVTPLTSGGNTNYFNITVQSDVDRSRTSLDIQRAIATAQAAQYADLYRGGAMSQLLSTTGRA